VAIAELTLADAELWTHLSAGWSDPEVQLHAANIVIYGLKPFGLHFVKEPTEVVKIDLASRQVYITAITGELCFRAFLCFATCVCGT